MVYDVFRKRCAAEGLHVEGLRQAIIDDLAAHREQLDKEYEAIRAKYPTLASLCSEDMSDEQYEAGVRLDEISLMYYWIPSGIRTRVAEKLGGVPSNSFHTLFDRCMQTINVYTV